MEDDDCLLESKIIVSFVKETPSHFVNHSAVLPAPSEGTPKLPPCPFWPSATFLNYLTFSGLSCLFLPFLTVAETNPYSWYVITNWAFVGNSIFPSAK